MSSTCFGIVIRIVSHRQYIGMASFSSNIQRLGHHTTSNVTHSIPDGGKHHNNYMPLYIHFHHMFVEQCRPLYIQIDPTYKIFGTYMDRIYLIAKYL